MRPSILVCALLVLSSSVAATAAATENTLVRFETDLGTFDVMLYDADTPITVENFLTYVYYGDYNSSFFHRLVPGFILQGGGFWYNTADGNIYNVWQDPPIANEFLHSNVRGTIAMAKLGGDPDSATNQFFFNLADNSANLDYQNGGFTVFGRVIGDGMNVVDRLAAAPPNPDNVQVWDYSNYNSAFGELPLIDGTYIEMVYSVTVVPKLSWSSPAGLWTDSLWYDGAQNRGPSQQAVMIVSSGQVDVVGSFTDEWAAAWLSVVDGSVHVAAGSRLDVTGDVTVDAPGTLVVDGTLNVAGDLRSAGTLSGSGAIAADRVVISGVLSPSAPAAAPTGAATLGATVVPEPGVLVLLALAGLALLPARQPAGRSSRRGAPR